MEGGHAWNFSRIQQNPGVALVIFADILFGERLEIHSCLARVRTTPDETVAIFGDGDRMMGAAFDHGQSLPTQTGDLGGFSHTCLTLSGIVSDAALAEAVEAPRPHVVPAVDGEGVVCADTDDFDLLLGQPKLTGRQAGHARALDHATAELVLLAAAPGEDTAGGIQGEDVVGAAFDLLNLGEAGYEHWRSLNLDVRCEAEDAFVALL